MNGADDDFRDFIDVYVGTLLFFCYTIHQISSSYFENPVKQIFGQWMFCVAITTEACFLIWASSEKFDARGGVEQSLIDDPNNIMSQFTMYYNLEYTLFWQSMIVRSLCWVVFFSVFVLDVFGIGADFFDRLAKTPIPFYTELVYCFCFLLVMTSCGLFVLYLVLNTGLSGEDFSFIAGSNCDGVVGLKTDAEVVALNGTAVTCVEQVAWYHEYANLSTFFSTYVTTLVFYALTLIEGLEFIKVVSPDDGTPIAGNEAWLTRGRFLLVMILIVEVGSFLISCLRLWAERGETTWSLENNNPSGGRCDWLVYSILMIRGASMALMYAVLVMAKMDSKDVFTDIFKTTYQSAKMDESRKQKSVGNFMGAARSKVAPER